MNLPIEVGNEFVQHANRTHTFEHIRTDKLVFVVVELISGFTHRAIRAADEVENRPAKIECDRAMQITTVHVWRLITIRTRFVLSQAPALGLITNAKSTFQFLSHRAKRWMACAPLIDCLKSTKYSL